jgi:two-component system chemotaxis response regulator CheY
MARILIVDDSNFMILLLTNMLDELGHNVVGSAHNGEEAFALYKYLNPDLVTMDITMPFFSGLEGLKLIRDYDNEAKVVMCTAMGQQSMILEAIQKGASDFLVKPFKKETVKESIEKTLSV